MSSDSYVTVNKKSARPSVLRKILAMPEFSVFIALLIMILIMSFASPFFLRINNVMNVLNQIARYGIIAVGMSLIIISGGIDLSVGFVVGFSACIFAYLSLNTSLPWPLVLFLTLSIGAAIGLLNGIIITRIGLVPFIVTLASMRILGGATLLLTRGMPISFESPLSWLGQGRIGGVIPVSVVIMFVLMFAGSIFAKFTETGRGLYAIGNNERAAKLSGINTLNLKCLTYIITSVLCALVGIIVAGNLATADPSLGVGYELDIIAAAVIGGIAMSGGEGHVWGSLIGVAIIGILRNSFILLGISSYWQSIVIGVVIVAAVTIDKIRGMKRG